jgi:hypothetical protein
MEESDASELELQEYQHEDWERRIKSSKMHEENPVTAPFSPFFQLSL